MAEFGLVLALVAIVGIAVLAGVGRNTQCPFAYTAGFISLVLAPAGVSYDDAESNYAAGFQAAGYSDFKNRAKECAHT